MSMIKTKQNIKTIERHPVKILGNDYKVKIIYKFVKVSEVNVEENTIKIVLPSKYKKVNNDKMLDLAIDKMYEAIAKKEVERAMEKIRIMVGFAPEDYKIQKVNGLGKCENDIITINPNIVMYKREIIDYIVLKQYCHLKYKTECKSFIKLLSKYCVDYKKFEKSIEINM